MCKGEADGLSELGKLDFPEDNAKVRECLGDKGKLYLYIYFSNISIYILNFFFRDQRSSS